MKTAKYILFTLMSVLLVLTAIMGYVVFDHAMALLRPSGGNGTVQTPPSSSESVPVSSEPATSLPPVHQCEYTIKGATYKPTCEMLGYTVYGCECGRSTFDDYVDPLGHDYGEPTLIDPTCTTDGCTERKCSRCSNIERTNIIPAAHTFGQWESTANYEWRVCSVCSFKEQCSADSGPMWKMKIATLENVGEYAHLQILLTLDGSEKGTTYDIYVGLPDQLPAFDCLNSCLVISFLEGEDTKAYYLTAEMTVLTIHPDGTPEMIIPTPPVEDPVPDTPAEE